ncbi:MAG: class I SAM-dependent methyltransferase [Candidatus Nanohaloarchaea archaeon]
MAAGNDLESFEDRRAEGVWDDQTTFPNRYDGFREGALSYVEDRDDVYLVDIGCSTGEPAYRFSQWIEEQDVHTTVHGVDIDGEAVREAASEGRVDEYSHSSASDTGLETGQADMVVCKTLLSRIRPEHQSEALQEINRIVPDDGVALLEVDIFGKDKYTGNEYAIPGDELDELADETDGFTDYPVEEFEQYRIRDEQETGGFDDEAGVGVEGIVEQVEGPDEPMEEDEDFIVAS